MADEKKKDEQADQQPSEKKEISPEQLLAMMNTEYNVLMSKINMYPNLPLREVQLARTKLEESFLWLRCSIEKLSQVSHEQ